MVRPTILPRADYNYVEWLSALLANAGVEADVINSARPERRNRIRQ
jgi:hypothetical protein